MRATASLNRQNIRVPSTIAANMVVESRCSRLKPTRPKIRKIAPHNVKSITQSKVSILLLIKAGICLCSFTANSIFSTSANHQCQKILVSVEWLFQFSVTGLFKIVHFVKLGSALLANVHLRVEDICFSFLLILL